MSPVLAPPWQVRADFDRLALLDGDRWDHNAQYHAFLLRHLPPACGPALEIGCGAGAFARLLARRCAHVTGLDLSPVMVRLARERSLDLPNVSYRVEDAAECELPEAGFDCVASIATLHHLPFEPALERMARALRPGGVLLVLDLVEPEAVRDGLRDLLAFPAALLLHRLRAGSFRDPREVRRAWREHGESDTYLRLSEVRAACARLLPGAEVRRHLLWRYSIVWQRPCEPGGAR